MKVRAMLNGIVALILIASAFTPLLLGISEEQKQACLNKPGCKVPIAYAYENIAYLAKEVVVGTRPLEKDTYLIAFWYFSAYIAPILLMLCKPHWQAIGLISISYPAGYLVHHFLTAYHFALVGSWLLLAAWLILSAQVFLVMWQKLPHNKSLKVAP